MLGSCADFQVNGASTIFPGLVFHFSPISVGGKRMPTDSKNLTVELQSVCVQTSI